MGMSTNVIGIRPADETFLKMKSVWDACTDLGVSIPAEVSTFFNGERPDDLGVVVEIKHTTAVKNWHDSSREGFEVDITKLPAGVKVVRFYNSW
jgi:hypothetical protein